MKNSQFIFVGQAATTLTRTVEKRAAEVLGSKRTARAWMRTPQHALAEKVPLEILATPEGVKEVLNLLGAIEDGGYL